MSLPRVNSLLVLLLLGAPTCLQAGEEAKKKAAEDLAGLSVVEQIYVSNATKHYLKRKNRYKPPKRLTEESTYFHSLPEADKEELLLAWFMQKNRAFYRKEALQRAFVSLVVCIILGGLFYSFLGKIALSLVRSIWGYFFPPTQGADQKSPVADALGKIFEYFNLLKTAKEKEDFKKGLSAVYQQVSGFMGKGMVAANAYMLYNLKGIFQFSYKHAYWLYQLIVFIYRGEHEDALKDAEHLYVRSLHLFDAHQRRAIEQLLFAKRNELTQINEVTMFIRRSRAVPHGIKDITYRQELIDRLFVGYDAQTKKVAEQIIMMLTIYTEALKQGEAELLKEIPIKGILLLGPPGTGKSHFIKQLCKAFAINFISLSLNGDTNSELKGKVGEKLGLGIPSAYSRALERAADQQGRVYENSILCFEEIDKFLDNPAIINFLHIFLDPKVDTITDEYLGMEVPKVRIIFATSNYPLKIPALNDRFQVFRINEITPENKQRIIRDSLIPNLQAFFSQQAVARGYAAEELLTAQEWAQITEETLAYMREHKEQPGMRSIEEFAMNKALALRVAKKQVHDGQAAAQAA